MLAPVAIAAPITFLPGDLAVLYSVYPGLPNPNTGSTGGYTTPNITAGVTQLPINPPVTAIAGGSYPNVFNNAQVDANFGVTSPIYLAQITTALSCTDHDCRPDREHYRSDGVDRHHDELPLEIGDGAQFVDEPQRLDLSGIQFRGQCHRRVKFQYT